MNPVVIAVAITGSVPRKKDNPALPVTPPEQIESTHEAYEAGASLVVAGAGVALLPRHTAPTPPGLVLRPLRDLTLARHVDALVRPERALRRSVAAVLASLTEAAERLLDLERR